MVICHCKTIYHSICSVYDLCTNNIIAHWTALKIVTSDLPVLCMAQAPALQSSAPQQIHLIYRKQNYSFYTLLTYICLKYSTDSNTANLLLIHWILPEIMIKAINDYFTHIVSKPKLIIQRKQNFRGIYKRPWFNTIIKLHILVPANL